MTRNKYDEPGWHHDNPYLDALFENDEDQAQIAASQHIAFYFAWAVLRDLASPPKEPSETAGDRQRLFDRRMTPGAYYSWTGHDKFGDWDLNAEGASFTEAHYRRFLEAYSAAFVEQYKAVDAPRSRSKLDWRMKKKLPPRRFGGGRKRYASMYAVEDSWRNFEVVSAILDRWLHDWRTKED
ncbi:MAG: hypothetical protein AAGK00_05035 [Pseudomonadota bacterium]